MQIRPRPTWLALCAVSFIASPELLAQGPVLEEVVVTARKRQESIIAVPVVATALGREQLEKFGIDDVYAVADRVPGLQLGSGQAAFGTQISLRGVGTSTLSASIDQSISLNIDGLQLSQGLAFKAGMLDVDQIEVLKGPQALFFGKNSPGGVISLHSADPGGEPEVIVRAAHEFEGKENTGELVLSGPLTDTFGLRLATSYGERDGYFHNKARPSRFSGGVPGGKDPDDSRFPDDEELIVRGTAVWTPTEEFRARLKLNYTDYKVEGDGGELQLKQCPDGLGSWTGMPFIGGDDCGLDRDVGFAHMDPAYFPGVPNGGVPYQERDQLFGTLELNYTLDALTLTSITGFYDVDHEQLMNASSTSAIPAIALVGGLERKDRTQELRLTSDYASDVNFMLGAYYQSGEIKDSSLLTVNQAFWSSGFPPALMDSEHTIDIRARSVFGQILWDIRPDLELSFGARWTDEERKQKTFVRAEFTTDDIFMPGVNAPAWVDLDVPKISTSNWSPELTLTWRPHANLTVFGALKRGFKSGSFNSLGATSSDQSYGDEKVTGGELGLKSRLMDGRMNFNAATYYYEYDDMQVGALENTGTAFRFRTINAASAEIYGAEFDVEYLFASVEGLSLRGAVNYNHARFEKFDNAPCYVGQTVALGCNRNFDPNTGLYTAQDLSGDPLMRAPDWSASVGADYERPLGTSGLTLVLGATADYSGDYQTGLAMTRSTEQSSYVKTSASVALRSANDAWEVALVGKNMGDKITSGNCTVANVGNGAVFGGTIDGGATSGAGGIGETGCWTDRGREIWLRLTWRPLAMR
jgi:iron complex outermembrane receptor protein